MSFLIDTLQVGGALVDGALETENPVAVAGKAVTSATYSPNHTDGDRATFAVDKTSGGILSHIRQLAPATDGVSVAGDIVHDSLDSGAPIKFGGRASSLGNEVPAVADGDRVNAHFDVNGRLRVVNMGQAIISYLAMSARTSSPAVQTGQYNTVGRGLTVFINVTAVSGTPALTVFLDFLDPVSVTASRMLIQSAAISSTGLYRLVIYPGVDAVANQTVSDVLPRLWRVRAVHGNADSITYSIYETIQM